MDIRRDKHSYFKRFYRKRHISKWCISGDGSYYLHTYQWVRSNKNRNSEPAAPCHNRLWRHVCGYDNDII